MSTQTSAGVITCPSNADGVTSVIATSIEPKVILLIGVNQDDDGWESGGRDMHEMSFGAVVTDGLANAAWTEAYYGPGDGYFGRTAVYDDRCFQTQDVALGGSECRGTVTAATSGGFTFQWTKAIAGRRVFYLAIGDPDGAIHAVMQDGFGTVDVGAPAQLAMLLLSYTLNAQTGSNPFGGFVWACDNGQSNGFSEYSLLRTLFARESKAWAWPSITTPTAPIPVCEPWVFGLLIGYFQPSNQDPIGWSFPQVAANAARAFAMTASPDEIRQRSVNANGDFPWGDTYTASAVLTCSPSYGPGWAGVISAFVLTGTGFGIDTEDGSLRVSLGVGVRPSDGLPYSWLLTDRSWVSDVDREAAGTGVRAGHILMTSGHLDFVVDDTDGTQEAVGVLAIGVPAAPPLVSLSAVKMARHGGTDKVKG